MDYRVEQAMNAQLRVKGKLQQFICQETINLLSLWMTFGKENCGMDELVIRIFPARSGKRHIHLL